MVILTTYFSLILGELIPKKIAMNNPEKIASQVSGFMKFISRAMSPVVRLVGKLDRSWIEAYRVSSSKEPPITEDEIKGLIEEGTQVGVFDEAEQVSAEGGLQDG